METDVGAICDQGIWTSRGVAERFGEEVYLNIKQFYEPRPADMEFRNHEKSPLEAGSEPSTKTVEFSCFE